MEKKKAMQIEGYPIEGLSIGGHETCIIFPSLRIAFDIGRCPHRAISQDFLFISHSHMDHIVSIIFLNLLIKNLNFPIGFATIVLWLWILRAILINPCWATMCLFSLAYCSVTVMVVTFSNCKLNCSCCYARVDYQCMLPLEACTKWSPQRL